MGKTILVSSHILPELAEMCTGVAIIDRGRLLRSGTHRRHRALAASKRSAAHRPARRRGSGDGRARVARNRSPHRRRPRGDEQRRWRGAHRGVLRRARPDAQADLLRAMVEAGHRVVGFSQATSDLEEIFLQVTGQTDEETAA